MEEMVGWVVRKSNRNKTSGLHQSLRGLSHRKARKLDRAPKVLACKSRLFGAAGCAPCKVGSYSDQSHPAKGARFFTCIYTKIFCALY